MPSCLCIDQKGIANLISNFSIGAQEHTMTPSDPPVREGSDSDPGQNRLEFIGPPGKVNAIQAFLRKI